MHELISPVNPRTILKFLGRFMMGAAFVLAVPGGVAAFFGEFHTALVYAGISGTVLLVGWLVDRSVVAPELEKKEALVIAGIIFPLLAFLNAIPLSISGRMPFLDVFFESVSGVTTTGLSVAPHTVGPLFLFVRAWSQWIGGIGIVLVVLILLLQPGTSAFRLFSVTGGQRGIRSNVVDTAYLLGAVYLILTILSVIILLLAGMTPFDSVCHAFASVSTGGFSTHPDSIAGYAGTIIPLAIVACFMMGVFNFALYINLPRDPLVFFRDPSVRAFAVIVLAGVGLLTITLWGTGSTSAVLSNAAFHAFSALSTTGFDIADVDTFPDAAKWVITVLMWVGGSVGSTAGGIKLIRIIILFRLVQMVFTRIFIPREAITPLKVGDEVVDSEDLHMIVTFVLLYVGVIIVTAGIFMAHGFNTADAIFEVSSALGTVGLSTGITAATLPAQLKGVLIINMLFGRLEIIPLSLLFMPRTWVRGR
ncbi:MAG: TrkH family potassium uptake protein [Methanoculleaceae archaeon]